MAATQASYCVISTVLIGKYGVVTLRRIEGAQSHDTSPAFSIDL